MKYKKSIDDKVKKMSNEVIYHLVQLVLSIYEPGEELLQVCHSRYSSPKKALEALRQQHKIPNQVLKLSLIHI